MATRIRNKEEHDLQVACIRWLRYAHPDVVCFAVPNGGARDAVTGAMLKAEGVTRGAPDLMAFAPGGRVCAVEMKTANGRQSEWQVEMQQRLERNGIRYEVCRSFDDFVAVVRSLTDAVSAENRQNPSKFSDIF